MEATPLPNVGGGLLRASRAKSYGSLVRSPLSPARQRCVEHTIQPGETLQGLALKYGVSMEQIKRANRMYTNDSIFLKKSLSIPVLSDLDCHNSGMDLLLEDSKEDNAGCASADKRNIAQISCEKEQGDGRERPSDLSPVEFLKRLDALIYQSNQAAVRGCQEAEKRSQSVISSSGMQQQAAYGGVPLTITKLTKNLRDREDEIFQL
uniref:LysM and putative peptidoglycan-binding domain-containing protein 1 n=1 Tax=Mola mola TaxID=94237 RepID=A0A3Q3VP13_MOLML